jgi:hypothetical protein
MQRLLYETLHVEDFKIVGKPLNAVSLIEVDEDAVQRRADALIAENVRASKKAGRL